MKLNKIAFLTTIFPMKEDYLSDFLNSLSNQTYKVFDLIVINDNYENFHKIKLKYKNLNIIELKYSNTPAKNREYGINYCIKQKYDIIIFGDSDDYFKNNRIEKSIELLEKYDIVVNDLTLFDELGNYQTNYISNRINNNTEMTIDFIKDKNIFGLSNTAINTNILDKISLNENLIAVDWYIFSLLLINSHKSIFTSETVTFYRQHESNTIGMNQITKSKVLNGLKIKYIHYRELIKIDKKFEKFYKDFKSLFDKVVNDKNNLEAYFYYVNNLEVKNLFWWENIKEM